ncbi:MAG TPA: alginate export family protein [Vicinamibacteria bacterium]|nr:alginate export family protein [Vicinamibacteria bacterium]
MASRAMLLDDIPASERDRRDRGARGPARPPSLPVIGAACTALLLAVPAPALAQEPPAPAPPPPAEEERSTGLPKKGHWTFNLDAGLGGFGFANSLYTDVRPDPSGNLGDDWAETFVKPALSARFGAGKSEIYGKLSAVGERTFAGPPSVVGEDASSFEIEDGYLGWRSGTALGGSQNLLDFTVGRAPYTIGHGMLLWDGAGEGGSRGGYWTNARKAWQFAAVGRARPKHNTIEVFYLDRDDLPEHDTGTRLWGANYELALGDKNTFGASYMKFHANHGLEPNRDGMNVYDARAYTSPLQALPGLAFELEYAHEQSGELLKSNAFTAQAGYEMDEVAWKPRLSYRYAYFQGDDPNTPTNEGFDMLLPGFHDWGTWWQGEIAGEYFISNSNMVSHQVRLHLTPSASVSGGLIAYLFRLDEPTALGPHVTSKDVAFELDSYCDWKLNRAFTVSFVAAFASPQAAVQQAYDRTKSFLYGMVYVAYSY